MLACKVDSSKQSFSHASPAESSSKRLNGDVDEVLAWINACLNLQEGMSDDTEIIEEIQ